MKKHFKLITIVVIVIALAFGSGIWYYKNWVTDELIPGLRYEYIRGEFDSSEFLEVCHTYGWIEDEYVGEIAKTPKQVARLVERHYYWLLSPNDDSIDKIIVYYDSKEKLWCTVQETELPVIGSSTIMTISSETGMVTEWNTGMK